MKELRLTARAQADLGEIETHSRTQWGDAQAVAYRRIVAQRLHGISQRPALGVTCDYVVAGMRRMSAGVHVIFYVEHDAFVLVVRVLHQRMDYRTHLRDLPDADS